MKVASHEIAGVLKNTAPFGGILFYGEDAGRIRDHVVAVTQQVLGAASDPFRLSVLTREEHSRLRNEVAARALGGGRRVIRVQDAADGLATMLDEVARYRADTLVVMEATQLTPRSKLRSAAEKHPHWAVIACYPATGAALATEIQRILAATEVSAEASALAYLAQELAGDSNRRRAELEKLILYAENGRVTLEAAQACCSASLDASLGMAISAALAGKAAECDALLEELGRDGATGPGVLAVLSNQVQRLLKVRLMMEGGSGVEAACRGLQPPIFPRQMPAFVMEVQRWSVPKLEALGRAIREADLACKRAGSPDFTIAARLLGVVASRAAKA